MPALGTFHTGQEIALGHDIRTAIAFSSTSPFAVITASPTLQRLSVTVNVIIGQSVVGGVIGGVTPQVLQVTS